MNTVYPKRRRYRDILEALIWSVERSVGHNYHEPSWNELVRTPSSFLAMRVLRGATNSTENHGPYWRKIRRKFDVSDGAMARPQLMHRLSVWAGSCGVLFARDRNIRTNTSSHLFKRRINYFSPLLPWLRSKSRFIFP